MKGITRDRIVIVLIAATIWMATMIIYKLAGGFAEVGYMV
jgi:hypothetical protein